jgi:hypothetical protein
MKDKFWIFLAIVAIGVFLTLVALSNQNETNYCQSFSYATCPEKCVVCPPCEMCSSVSCQTESYCKSIGFNRSWSEEVSKVIPARE